MELKTVLDYVMPICGVLALYILNRLSESLEKATSSVNELNIKVGIVIERTERHDEEIRDMKNNHVQFRERLHEFGNHINKIHGRMEKDRE